MNLKFFLAAGTALALSLFSPRAVAQANTALSNLIATSINQSLVPGGDNSRNLGSATRGWRQLYLSDALYLGGKRFVSYGGTGTAQSKAITAVGFDALRISTGANNTAMGYSSLYSNTTGASNVAFGSFTLLSNTTGTENTAIGHLSLNLNSNGNANTAIGAYTLQNNTSGAGNVAAGNQALNANTTGNYNTATGYQSLFKNSSGSYNTASGFQSLYANTTGMGNSALGFATLTQNTSGSYNTAIGNSTLVNNTAGSNSTAVGSQAMYFNRTGYNNTALGFSALRSNTDGYNNTAVGYNSLTLSTSSNNTAVGVSSLANNTGNNNTAMGSGSMAANTTGTNNVAAGFQSLSKNAQGSYLTAVGSQALFSNTSAGLNTAIGYQSLYANTTGTYNTASGVQAMFRVTTGTGNTGLGTSSLSTLTGGNSNTAIGAFADVSDAALTNTTSIGYSARATASNQIMLGNSSVTSVKVAGNIVLVSDGRFKKDVKADVPGLEFINELRPVTYHYDVKGMNALTGETEARQKAMNALKNTGESSAATSPDATETAAIAAKEKKQYTGFIAQEVEAAAKKHHYDFSGVYAPANSKDLYGLSYSDFVVPLVKAVQELSKTSDEKDAEIDSIQVQIDQLRSLITGSSAAVSLTDASLNQNLPNPFTGRTNIGYRLPLHYGRAKLTLTDMTGRIIKSVAITGNGKGNISIDAASLSAGVYNYSLYVDDTIVGTKQMILKK